MQNEIVYISVLQERKSGYIFGSAKVDNLRFREAYDKCLVEIGSKIEQYQFPFMSEDVGA